MVTPGERCWLPWGLSTSHPDPSTTLTQLPPFLSNSRRSIGDSLSVASKVLSSLKCILADRLASLLRL